MNAPGSEAPCREDSGEFLPEAEFEGWDDVIAWGAGFALAAWVVIFCSGST